MYINTSRSCRSIDDFPATFYDSFFSEPLCIVYYYRTLLEKHKCLNTRFSCWKENEHKEGKLRKQQQRTIISTENICQAFIYGCLKSREKSFRLSFFIALSISTPSRASSASNNFVFPLIFLCVYVRSTEEIIWWYFLHKKLRRESFSLLFFSYAKRARFSLVWGEFLFFDTKLCARRRTTKHYERASMSAPWSGGRWASREYPVCTPVMGKKTFQLYSRT